MSINNFTEEVADAIKLAANETKFQPSALKVEVIQRSNQLIVVTQKMANGKTHRHEITVRRVKV